MNRISCLVLDVDGVLTDSRIYFTDEGIQIKAFNSKDGHGLRMLLRAGIEVVIITGRTSKALEYRAAELGIKHVILPEHNRGEWSEVPAEVRGKVTVHFVKHVSELLPLALRAS